MPMPHRTASHRTSGVEMESSGVGVDAASVLMLLSRRQQGVARTAGSFGARGRGFECKTCGRRFPTFQALGGHRTSHRRPKPYPYGGDPATRLPPHEGECAPAVPRLHGCPICGLQFAVGQALGGHMRRHRHRAAPADDSCSGDANAASVEEADVGCSGCSSAICLELNLAPSENCAKCRDSTVHCVGKSRILDCPRL